MKTSRLPRGKSIDVSTLSEEQVLLHRMNVDALCGWNTHARGITSCMTYNVNNHILNVYELGIYSEIPSSAPVTSRIIIDYDNRLLFKGWLGINHAVFNDCIIEEKEFWKNITKLQHITYGVEISK